jgi:hypothetical protein
MNDTIEELQARLNAAYEEVGELKKAILYARSRAEQDLLKAMSKQATETGQIEIERLRKTVEDLANALVETREKISLSAFETIAHAEEFLDKIDRLVAISRLQ